MKTISQIPGPRGEPTCQWLAGYSTRRGKVSDKVGGRFILGLIQRDADEVQQFQAAGNRGTMQETMKKKVSWRVGRCLEV